MLFTLPKMGLRGHFEWEVFDEKGYPSYALDQHGRKHEGGSQSNLILDSGLDILGTYSTKPGGESGAARNKLRVGTGSTAPAVTQTGLDAEVQNGGWINVNSKTYELLAGNVAQEESKGTYEVTMTADRNLTEFGLSPLTTGDLFCRELFRNAQGDPITLSLLSGKTLRVTHYLYSTVQLGISPYTLEFERYDAGNNLIATDEFDADAGLYATPSGYGGLFYLFQNDNPNSVGTDGRMSAYPSTDPTVGITRVSSLPSRSMDAYTPGTYERIKRVFFSTGGGIGDHYGFFFGATSGGFRVGLQLPDLINKSNTEELSLAVKVSWGRAS